MMNRDLIKFLKPIISQDEKLRTIITYVTDRPTPVGADFQPLNYSTQRMPFGITDKTSHLLLTRDPLIMNSYYLPDGHPDQFNSTYRIEFNGIQYSIDSILPFRRHFEIYVKKVL